MFNKVVLLGNLTKDGEIRYSQSGSAIYKNSIAVSRKFTSNGEKKEEVCFVDITFFGRSAEVANQYLRKGSKILVEGRLKLDQWVDQNGQKRSKHSVIVETMQMLDTKASQEGRQDSYQNQQQPSSRQQENGQQQQNNYQQQQSYNQNNTGQNAPVSRENIPKDNP